MRVAAMKGASISDQFAQLETELAAALESKLALEKRVAELRQRDFDLRVLLRKALAQLNDVAQEGDRSAQVVDEITRALDE